MKFNGSSSEILCRELRKNFSTAAKHLNDLLRKPVTVLTTWNFSEKTGRRERSRILYEAPEWNFKFFCENKYSFLKLCCMSWYLDDDIRVLLQLELQRQMYKYGPDYSQKIALLLQSEPQCIIYILESNVFGTNPNAVFGNIRANNPKIGLKIYNPQRFKDSHIWKFPGISVSLITSSVKKPEFHRGYRDKGSRRIGSEYLSEEKKDFTTTELQNQIELDRQATIDSISFWSGFLE